MTLTPGTYNFTVTDISEITLLGYNIEGQISVAFNEFMRQKFPNFDLLRLLKEVEKYFTPTTKIPIHRKIIVDDSTSKLSIDYQNEFTDEDDALVFIREFSVENQEINIEHHYCILPLPFRGKGLIKPVFQESLLQYVNMNANKISVHAGLSGGGYAWAKYGFVAINKIEVDEILSEAKKQLLQDDFDAVKDVYDIYYFNNPNGKSFPIDLWAGMGFMKKVLMGSDWHGELDLKNPSQFSNFKDYVFR